MSKVSRKAHFIRALFSGYATIGMNIFYTLATVPLTLQYLGKEEFGVWALVTQFSGYLILLEFGMMRAVARRLSDFKADINGRAYGNTLMTGAVIFLIQGVVITTLGVLFAWLGAPLMRLPEKLEHSFFILMSAQSIISGLRLSFDHLTSPLWCHQRLDLYNLSTSLSLASSFTVLWTCFHFGIGLDGLILSSATGSLVGLIAAFLSCKKLQLYPTRFWHHKFDASIFRNLCQFGSGSFMLCLGQQLTSASQVIIISQTLGIQHAATWSVCTKFYSFAQQFVYRISESSTSGLTDMYINYETHRLKQRFQELIFVSALVAALTGSLVAMVNGSFVNIWTLGQISWPPWNNYLLGCLLFATTITQCNIALTTIHQSFGKIKYIYFIEGIVFASLSFFTAHKFGFSGIILSALTCHIFITGWFSVKHTSSIFQVSNLEMIECVQRTPILLMLTAGICCFLFSDYLGTLNEVNKVFLIILIYCLFLIPFSWFVVIRKPLRLQIYDSAFNHYCNLRTKYLSILR
jgi:O-antigen/teichoic acid export membrane protein